jgi:predicted  nucleic acid-binding Zn-ribbon protein
MEEHEQKAEELEHEADRLEERRDELDDEISENRSDFEAKLGDTQAPGLLEEEDAAPGGLGPSEEEEGDDE